MINLGKINNFDLTHIFDCGQCFRFKKLDDGSYIGVAYGKVLHLYINNGEVFINSDDKIWKHFLDLDRDYSAILKEFMVDDFTIKAGEFGTGIRILRQEPFEALASFIISQCNNIPRIKSIINTLCNNFGNEIQDNGEIFYTFPTAEKIASLTSEDLSILRAGYRTDYLINAAKMVCSGEINFKLLDEMTLTDARVYIMKVHGIGAKVADCFLLFGMGKLDAFPIDTWMKKAKAFYDGDMSSYGKYAGIYQQYIFYYAKEHNLGK